MGFKEFFSPGKERELTLDIASLDKWPERLVRQQRLHEALATWLKDLERCRVKASEAKSRLTDPRLKAKKVPERGATIYEEHVKVLVERVDDLLKAVPSIEDVYLAETQQESFQNALKTYQESTRKSVAALKEYFGSELGSLSDRLRELEDTVLRFTATLDAANFSNVKGLKIAIDEYKASRQKEAQLQRLRTQLQGEIGVLEGRRLKIKEKIAYYIERAKTSAYKDLIAEEEQLLDKVDEVKTKFLPVEQEESELKPLLSRLAFLRKQMITDITSMNINEQRSFLENVKDDLRLRKKKLERVEEVLATMSFSTYRTRFAHLVEPFKVRIEDVTTIVEEEEDAVSPQ